MAEYRVTRAHLKKACEQKNWDLLDKLLEIDDTHLNDKSLFTDGWGDWWGLLLECVYRKQTDGVRVLLSHGAKRKLGRWGDGMPESPQEAAADKPQILALLKSKRPITYERRTDPPLPKLDKRDAAVNRQGDVRDRTGLVFPVDAFDEDDDG